MYFNLIIWHDCISKYSNMESPINISSLVVSTSGGSQAPLTVFLGLTGGKTVGGNAGASTGNVDLYTVPACKRLFVTYALAYNSTASTITGTFYFQAYISGAYRQLQASVASIAANGAASFTLGIVLEAGEKFSASIGTTGLSVNFRGILFDNSVPFYSPRLTAPSSGNNTLYTCPTSTNALVVGGSLFAAGGQIQAVNATGSSLTYKLYVVPNGGVAGGANAVTPTAGTSAITNSLINFNAFQFGIATGDFIVYNTSVSTSGQFVWVNVMETPN